MFKYHVAALGQAIMDMQAPVPDVVLASCGIAKGSHQLIDQPRMLELRNSLFSSLRNIGEPEIKTTRGGSAANTLGVVAALGGNAAFLSRFGGDELGEQYISQLRREKIFCKGTIDYDVMQGCSLIAVSPDGERSMSTFIGASGGLRSADVSYNTIADAKVTLAEGYLFDYPTATEAFYQAAQRIKRAGREMAVTLSDVGCVNRNWANMRDAVHHCADIVFANEAEIKAFYVAADFNEAVGRMAESGKIGVLTQGAQGATIVYGQQRVHVPIEQVKLVDTIGLGDAFAGGFLHAYTHGHTLKTAGRVGALSAANVALQAGAKPKRLKSFVNARLQQD